MSRYTLEQNNQTMSHLGDFRARKVLLVYSVDVGRARGYVREEEFKDLWTQSWTTEGLQIRAGDFILSFQFI